MIDERRRWAPLWAMIPVFLVFLGLCIITSRTHHGFAAIPFYSVLSYWVLLGLCNSSRVKVSPAGVRVTHGPLPIGLAGIHIARAQIQACYQEHFFASQDSFSTHIHNAGVQTADGQLHKVLGSFPTHAEANVAAKLLADALSGVDGPRLSSFDAGYLLPRRNMRHVWILIGWGLALIFGLIASAALTALPFRR